MKKIFFFSFFLLILSAGWTQSLEDAKKYIYYERFESAKIVLKSIIETGNASPDCSLP